MKMAYTPSYVCKIERGRQPPTDEFARRADEILDTGGTLPRLARAYRTDHRSPAGKREPPIVGLDALPRSLIVRHEDARLRYDEGHYHVRIRRHLFNGSRVPITRYLIRVSVDRHPEAVERSNALYRENPLSIGELMLHAECDGETMAFDVEHDRDAFKEIWLLFENKRGKFPLYPGQDVWIDYSYSASAAKWGKWFQRAIRVPTERLSVEIDFPAANEPAVWGLETSMSAERLPVRTAIQQQDDGDRRVYRWETTEAALHTRLRFVWRFNNEAVDADTPVAPSERMRRLGVLQSEEPMLHAPCERFVLPRDATNARVLGELLVAYLGPIRAAHLFSKGIGLAAPQIGIARAAAVVELPDKRPLVLYNPRITESSDETDDQHEGCLSFFDVRGVARRPLTIDVEHVTLAGEVQTTRFERGAARLWAHEIDHLDGILYNDRLAPGTKLIPVERYKGVGEGWRYT